MICDSMAVCPLRLLFKCHKVWTWQSGKASPTRTIAGENQGMNFPLSEQVGWVLEPVANAMVWSGELVSGEDLKSKIDNTKDK